MAILSSVLEQQTANYVDDRLISVVYISPSEDYDQYCDYVKKVERCEKFHEFP